jgi:hypothetical protein
MTGRCLSAYCGSICTSRQHLRVMAAKAAVEGAEPWARHVLQQRQHMPRCAPRVCRSCVAACSTLAPPMACNVGLLPHSSYTFRAMAQSNMALCAVCHAAGLIFVAYCVVCYLVTALLFSLLILDLAALVITVAPSKAIFKYTDLVYTGKTLCWRAGLAG